MEEDQALYIPSMGVGCGLISHVTDPVLVRKSGKMFGFWTRDNGDVDHKSVFVMEHFYKNTKMDKYRSMSGNDINYRYNGVHQRNRPRKNFKIDFLPENLIEWWPFWYHCY